MEHRSTQIEKTDSGISDSSSKPKNGLTQTTLNKLDTTKEEFSLCHKVTGSHSSIEHDKSEIKRNTGHRSKSFLEEPTRLKATSSLHVKNRESSRSTHGSHGDGISSVSLNAKGFAATEDSSLNLDQGEELSHNETEKPDIFQNAAPCSTQKLFDPEITFADLVRVYATTASKTEKNVCEVGNALLANAQTSTVVSDYLNTYQKYLTHLREVGVFDGGERETVVHQTPAAKGPPLFLPLSRMTPVFSDDSHNDPDFIDLLKKTTTESIRSLWPCKSKINIFNRGGTTREARNESKEEIESESKVPEADLLKGDSEWAERKECSDPALTQNRKGQDSEGSTSGTSNPYSDIDNADNPNAVSGNQNIISNSNVNLTETPSQEEGDEMVKATADTCLPFTSQPQPTSVNWSQATGDSDGDIKQPLNKQSQVSKMLHIQQKFIQQQNLQRQMMQQQQKSQQPQSKLQQQQAQQLQQDKMPPMSFYQEKERQPVDNTVPMCPKAWPQLGKTTHTSSGPATLTSGTQLTSAHSQPSTNAGLNGNDLYRPLSSVGYQQLGQSNSVESDSASLYPRRETPAYLRTLKASYACLDPQQTHHTMQPNDVPNQRTSLANDHITGPTVDQQFGFTSVNNSSLWPRKDVDDNLTDSKWSNPVIENSVQERLKHAYTRTKANQMLNSGAWSSGPAASDNPLYGCDIGFQGLSFQDPAYFGCLSDDGRKTGEGQSDFSSGKTLECGNPGDERPAQGTMAPGTNSLSGLSKLYQWRNDANFTQHRANANDLQSQGDCDLSWNASSVQGQIDRVGETFPNIHDGLLGPSLGFGMHGDIGVPQANDKKQQGVPLNFDPFHDSSHPIQNPQGQYLMNDSRQFTWASGGLQTNVNHPVSSQGSSLACGPSISNSMRFLNQKILSAQSLNKKEKDESCFNNNEPAHLVSTSASNELNRFGGSFVAHEKHFQGNLAPQFSFVQQQHQQIQQHPQQQQHSMQQSFQQSQQQHHHHLYNKQSGSMFSLSDELERTCLNDNLPSTPWHELASEEQFNNSCEVEQTVKKPLPGQQTHLPENTQSKDKGSNNNQNNTENNLGESFAMQTKPTTHRPRLILGANSLPAGKQNGTEEQIGLEESNRRLREMLGIASNGEKTTKILHRGDIPTHTLVSGSNGHPQIIANNGQCGQATRMPSSSIGQQMYCLPPNIIMPPPASQAANMGRMSNIGPQQRFPGMIRVPYVDMSRVVYIQQMPVNMASAQTTNNNYNNSTSSNPHVNVSNIITINTDKDFGNGVPGDKASRSVRQVLNKNKTTFIKVRSGTEEYALPVLDMRPNMEDNAIPRHVKARINPWDQDLDQDFNSSLLSKANAAEQAVANLGGMHTPLENADQGNKNMPGAAGSDNNVQTATLMQWPASADLHPEMLDMLPVRRAGPDDMGVNGRVCWPDMEFMLSSRDQMQNSRRSNKPMGSNKANLISIIPKGSISDGPGVGNVGMLKDLETT